MAADPGRPKLPRSLLLVIACHLCIHSAMAGMRIATPLLALQQGHSKLQAGLLVALFAGGQLLFALRAGRMADVHGLRRPAIVGVCAALAAAVMATLWPVYPVLCVSAPLTGVALVTVMVAVQRHLGRAVPDSTQLRQAFAWFSLAPPTANVVGPLLAGWCIDHLGFRAAFGAMAVLPVLAWLCVRHAPEALQGGRHAAAPGSAWDLWRETQFRRLMIVNWLFAAGWDIFGFMVPVLGHERGLSASAIAMLMGTYSASAFAMRGLIPFLTARMPEWLLITIAAGIATVLLALFPFMPTALAMGLCAAPLGMVMGGVHPMLLVLLHEVTPHRRHGQAVAMRLLMMNASGVSMPVLSGLAGGLLGAAGVFWVMAALMGTGPFLSTRLREHQQHDREAG